MKTEPETAVRAEINVTPLVDVVLVLLIIFMVVTPLMISRGIQLPNGKHPGPAPDEQHSTTISLTSEGLLFFEREPVSEQGLEERLRTLYGSNPETQLVLRADRRVTYGDVHRILDVAAGAGFRNLALLADPAPQIADKKR